MSGMRVLGRSEAVSRTLGLKVKGRARRISRHGYYAVIHQSQLKKMWNGELGQDWDRGDASVTGLSQLIAERAALNT